MSTGMNAATGRTISDWDHVQQSLAKIMTTALRSRVMRRLFGSRLPRLVDQPINPVNIVDFYAAMAEALSFEPRFKATRLALEEAGADGTVQIAVTGVYYPRALAGDFTGAVKQTAAVSI